MSQSSSLFWELIEAARKTLGLSERALADLSHLKEGRLFDQRTRATRRSRQPTADVVAALARGFRQEGLKLSQNDLVMLAYGEGDDQRAALGRLTTIIRSRHRQPALSRRKRRRLRRGSRSKQAA